MSDFLQQMAARSRERAAAAPQKFRDAELDAPRVPLTLGRFEIIAELKDRSPSAGDITPPGYDRLRQADAYARGGAAAVSVLTEPSRFGGDLAHLAEVAARLAPLGIPAMRKDFLVAESQVLEARAAGAGGVLLIVAMLDEATLVAMLDCAWQQEMFVLLEAFDREDLERAAALLERPRVRDQVQAGRLLVGVNTRDLRTLAVDASRLRTLSASLPPTVPCVAESGLTTAADAAAVAGIGYRLALVGSALMQSDDATALLQDMLDTGRARSAA